MSRGSARSKMLIDQILNDPLLAQADKLLRDHMPLLTPDLRGRMSKAHKFVLQRDFAMAADEISLDVDNINKMLPLARLPYPECWFEVVQADRRAFSSAPLEEGDGAISRVGCMCTQLDHNGSWMAQLFWSFAKGETMLGTALPPSMSGFTLTFDATETDATKPILFSDAPRYSSMSDWVGEPGFLIATLALLNSRNASELQPVNPRNKTRKLTGKRLLYSYHLLSIPSRYKQRNVASAGDDPRQLRAHFVRGHFKVRKSGIFFWSAFQRGNPDLGFVHKDYQLRLSA